MWNFFDRSGDAIEIRFKLSEYMTWQKWSIEKELSPVGLFFNADLNLSLAHYNIVEHFITDLQVEGVDTEQLTSYKLLKSFLMVDLTERWSNTVQFQFKILVYKDSKPTDLFASPWIQVEKS